MPSFSGGDLRPAWMRTLSESVSNWLKSLPDSLSPLKRSAEGLKDPLFRFFEREIRLGIQILAEVRTDLTEIGDICHGRRKQTNAHRCVAKIILCFFRPLE